MFFGQGFDFNDDGVTDAYVFRRVRPITLPRRYFWLLLCGLAVFFGFAWNLQHKQEKWRRLFEIEDKSLISVPEARLLVDNKEPRDRLNLRNLVSVSPDVAQELGSYNGTLVLPKVEFIDLESASRLSAVDGLILDGVKDISAEVASALAQTKSFLGLDGLRSCTDDVAKALSRHCSRHSNPTGTLHLNGLSTLSDAAAEALAKHEGGLSLLGLTKLSDNAAKALASNPDNRLNARFSGVRPASVPATPTPRLP